MQICYCTLYIACIQLHLYVAHNPTPTAQLDEALRPYARSYSWSCMAEPLSQGAQLHLQRAASVLAYALSSPARRSYGAKGDSVTSTKE